MSCGRAREVDLAAYLVDPEATQWEAFRRHYPSCPDCARTVARWTRLERALQGSPAGAGSHPPVEQLERLRARPEAFAPAERRALELHLASCRSCADEAAAERSFDYSALPAPRARAGDALRELLRGLGERVRGLGGRVREEGARIAEGLVPGPEPQVVLAGRDRARRAEGGAARVATLRGLGGEAGEATHPLLAGENRIGRSPECEVAIASDALARVEARVTASAGRLEIELLNRRGELRVNGAEASSAPLREGDLVELAGLRFRIERAG